MGTSARGINLSFDITSSAGYEKLRSQFQRDLISRKSSDEIKKNGQVETPHEISQMMVRESIHYLPVNEITILEPAMGSGSLVTACFEELDERFQFEITGIEKDEDFFGFADSFYNEPNLEVVHADFLHLEPKQEYSFVIANPPYTRHHLLSKDEKRFLKNRCLEELGISVSSLSGLYIYFILMAHKWLAAGGLSCWIIPQEFLTVNYGRSLRQYLLRNVNLKRIHIFDYGSSLFDSALVSSCILWFSNDEDRGESFEVTSGPDCSFPEKSKTFLKSGFIPEEKWIFDFGSDNRREDKKFSIGDFFDIKRGIASGDNSFFILSGKDVQDFRLSKEYLTPILPSPRYLEETVIVENQEGAPALDNINYLVNTRLNPEEIKMLHPELWDYLKKGVGTVSEKYLCRSRKEWYFQEQRKPPLFLYPYFSRKSKATGETTFKPVLNLTSAIATNSYLLLYPKDGLRSKIQSDSQYVYKLFEELQRINLSDIECYGRNYGGGLNKVEPKELPKIPCKNLADL